MTEEITQSVKDAEEHRKSYDDIMTASTHIGVPLVMALAVFFTNLVMANGVLTALLAGVVTYVFIFLIVKSFFSH